MKKTVRFGVIGCGRIGTMHAENIINSIPEATLVRAADPCADKLQDWAQSAGVPVLTTDYREVIDDPQVDAVMICSPTETHADYIVQCAEAGKDVLSEKPLSLDVREARRAVSAAGAAGIKLQLGFQRRFDSNAQTIRKTIESGEIGTPELVRITSRDPAPPPIAYVEVSGGIYVDMMIHDFDMARFLMQEEVVEVFAAGACLVDPAIARAGDVDTAIVTLRFANGAVGVINNSRRAVYGHDQRLEVLGSKGSAESSNRTDAEVTVSTERGVTGRKPLWFFVERFKEAYLAETRAFVDAVIHDAAVPVTGTDGVESLILGRAATESARTNRPIDIGEFRTQFE